MKIQCGTKAGWLQFAFTCLISSVIILCLITVSGCAKKEPVKEPEIPSNFTTYTDEAGLFSISYPPDWEPALSLIPGSEAAIKDIITAIDSNVSLEKAHVIFLAGTPDNGYLANVNIVVESMSGLVVTHKGMVEAGLSGLKQIMPDYRQISQVKTTVSGREATIVEAEGTYPQLGKIHNLQMYMLVGKTAWCVTCTPPQGEFDKWGKDFQAIARSLRILK